jgi:hypothetical protein
MASGTAPETAELQQDGFEYTEESTKQTGTKVFLIKRGFERGLPELGDPFDTSSARAECRLRRRSVSLYGPYADLWSMRYATLDDDQEAALDQSLSAVELMRNLDAGADAVNIGETFQSFDGTGNFLLQDAFVRHFTSNVQIKKVYMNFDKLLTTCRSYAGCINSVIIFGQPIGTVQLGPVTATEFVNKYGKKRWQASFTFMLRCIPDGLVLLPPATWNYAFNPEIELWEKLSPPLFVSKDISKVLA